MPFDIKGRKILQGNDSRVSRPCLVKRASSANLAMVVYASKGLSLTLIVSNFGYFQTVG